MDKFDQKIVLELQRNGRISNQDLAAKISLSPSPCLRRVRMLEERGVIAGYTAVINQKKLGKNLTLYVRVKIDRHCEKAIAEFERGIRRLDDVQSCHLISGEYDYLLHVVIESPEAYEVFLRERLHPLPGIAGIESCLAYGCIKPPLGVSI